MSYPQEWMMDEPFKWRGPTRDGEPIDPITGMTGEELADAIASEQADAMSHRDTW